MSEVVVIGGGVIGLTCAWRLAQRGFRVQILERHRCGLAATAASLGALWPSSPLRDGPFQQLHRQSLWSYEAFVKELNNASGVEIPYLRRGRLEMLTDPEHRAQAFEEAAAAVAQWPAWGHGPVMQVLDDKEVQSLEPNLQVGPLGAQWCQASAQVAVDPLLQALKTACQNLGVLIYEGVEVHRVLKDQDRVIGLETSSGRIPSHQVLLCSGAWTGDLIDRGVGRIRPVRGQALELAPGHLPIHRIVKLKTTYLIPWSHESLLVGSTTEAQAGFNPVNTVEGVMTLMAGLIEIVPSLKNSTVRRMWAGLRPDGPHHKPLLGPVAGTRGLFIAAGHYKLGIGMAPITGQIISDAIVAAQG